MAVAGNCRPIEDRGLLASAFMKSARQQLSGWGNCPIEWCNVARPEKLEALCSVIAGGDQLDYIPRGLGRSYGDSALNRNSGVLVQTRLSRFLSFDEEKGILECEAGVSFADIVETFLPLGWFIPTTPGTKYVTVGGAIAADVHGKNHHADGSFGNFVLDVVLLIAAGEFITCSPSDKADIFWATVGGMGLTGVIISARIKLLRVETGFVSVTYRRTANLDETFNSFMTNGKAFRYSVAWIDCLASGKSLGRSILLFANNAPIEDLPIGLRNRPLSVNLRTTKSVPFYFPDYVLNPWSIKTFNCLYYGTHRNKQTFIDYDRFFYPLDSFSRWNRIYGKRGFVQYQALFPHETARRGLFELLQEVANARRASFLAVLKDGGAASKGMLSYLYPGYTLALDFPNTGTSLTQLIRRLDKILLKYNGRLYLAKDATMEPAAFAQMYPRLAEFQQVKSRVDPNNRFVSSQARRLRIIES